MQVIVHYPKNELHQMELARKIAEIHVDCIDRFFKENECSKSRKREIISKIIKSTKESVNYENQRDK